MNGIYYILYIIIYFMRRRKEQEAELLTYQEKKSIVTLVSGILIFILYCLYMYPQYPEGSADLSTILHYWGSFVLVLTGVTVVAHIIISIVFNIIFRMTTGEKEPTFEDELDRLIRLKSIRNSFAVFVLGFLLAMGSLVIDQPLKVMFIILIAAGFLSDMTGSLSRLYHYRKGV